jgi:hypothetical protein
LASLERPEDLISAFPMMESTLGESLWARAVVVARRLVTKNKTSVKAVICIAECKFLWISYIGESLSQPG